MFHRAPHPTLPSPRSYNARWENALVNGLSGDVDSITKLTPDEIVNLFYVLLGMHSDGRDYVDSQKHPAYVKTRLTRHVHRDLLLRIILGGVSLSFFSL